MIEISIGLPLTGAVLPHLLRCLGLDIDQILHNFILQLARTSIGLLPSNQQQFLIVIKLLAMPVDLLILL